MSHAFAWKSAWEEIEDDPHFSGIKKYNHEGHNWYPGDQFWHTEDHYMIEIDAVKTKVYRGVVAPEGDEGNDCVFYSKDWSPPKNSRRDHHWSEDVHFMSVEQFAENIKDSLFVPHRSNGLGKRPRY